MPTLTQPVDYSNSVNITVKLLNNHVDTLKRRMKIGSELAAARSARVIAAEAAKNAPVLTGSLRDSIRAEGEGENWVVIVGAPYGAYVEFGTRFMAAQPYLLPAVLKRFPDMVNEMERAIDIDGMGSLGLV